MLELPSISYPISQKILKVKIITPFEILREKQELASEVFTLSKISSFDYNYETDEGIQHGSSCVYELKGLKDRISFQATRLHPKKLESSHIQEVFGTVDQQGLVQIKILPIIFSPVLNISLNYQVQVINSAYAPIVFEIDVSTFTLEQLSLLMTCIFRLINVTTDNYGIFEAIKICSLKIVNKSTMKKNTKINDDLFEYAEISETILFEEYSRCLELIKNFV